MVVGNVRLVPPLPSARSRVVGACAQMYWRPENVRKSSIASQGLAVIVLESEGVHGIEPSKR